MPPGRPISLASFRDRPGQGSPCQPPSPYRQWDKALYQERVRNIFCPLKMLARKGTGHPSQALICSCPAKPNQREPRRNATRLLWLSSGTDSLDGASSPTAAFETPGQHEANFMHTMNSGLEGADWSPHHSSRISFSRPFFNIKDTAGRRNGHFSAA